MPHRSSLHPDGWYGTNPSTRTLHLPLLANHAEGSMTSTVGHSQWLLARLHSSGSPRMAHPCHLPNTRGTCNSDHWCRFALSVPIWPAPEDLLPDGWRQGKKTPGGKAHHSCSNLLHLPRNASWGCPRCCCLQHSLDCLPAETEQHTKHDIYTHICIIYTYIYMCYC